MPGDPFPPRQRRIYLDADGGAYPEAEPGAGPRHHDDMPADPEAMQREIGRKSLDADLRALVADDKADRPEMVPFAPPPLRNVMRLVLGPDFAANRLAVLGVYVEIDPRAIEHARLARAVIVDLPIVEDFR